MMGITECGIAGRFTLGSKTVLIVPGAGDSCSVHEHETHVKKDENVTFKNSTSATVGITFIDETPFDESEFSVPAKSDVEKEVIKGPGDYRYNVSCHMGIGPPGIIVDPPDEEEGK